MSDYDPFDLEQQEARDDLRDVASKLASEVEESDFVWLMSGPKGRRIVRRLLDHAGVFRTSFHPNTMQMSLQEGQKQIGYWILGLIERLCLADYQKMIQEHRDDRAVASDRSNSHN